MLKEEKKTLVYKKEICEEDKEEIYAYENRGTGLWRPSEPFYPPSDPRWP